MNESTPFELPKSHEKLSYKFILDELKDRQVENARAPEEAALPICETAPALEVIPEAETATAEEAAPDAIPELALPDGKKYFRIGEVSELIGVESYVLRYWENEFKTVRPTKSKTGHRVYSANDVRALHTIRHLLHVEKFSVKGAKKKLQELKKKPNVVQVQTNTRHRDSLKALLAELKELVHIAKANPGTL